MPDDVEVKAIHGHPTATPWVDEKFFVSLWQAPREIRQADVIAQLTARERLEEVTCQGIYPDNLRRQGSAWSGGVVHFEFTILDKEAALRITDSFFGTLTL